MAICDCFFRYTLPLNVLFILLIHIYTLYPQYNSYFLYREADANKAMTKDRQNMQHRYIELFYDGAGSGGPGRGGGGGYGNGGKIFS